MRVRVCEGKKIFSNTVNVYGLTLVMESLIELYPCMPFFYVTLALFQSHNSVKWIKPKCYLLVNSYTIKYRLGVVLKHKVCIAWPVSKGDNCHAFLIRQNS